MNLLLIRHAEAGKRDAVRFPDDALRPVTGDGRARMTAVARAMVRLGIEFDVLLTSPLVRAVQTAEILAEVYGSGHPAEVRETLGTGCTAAAVLALLKGYPPEYTVALVGHEPAFSQVAAELIGAAGARITLKKGGTIGIAFDGAAGRGSGSLSFLLKPGQLRSIRKR